jgi:hypothetical protein
MRLFESYQVAGEPKVEVVIAEGIEQQLTTRRHLRSGKKGIWLGLPLTGGFKDSARRQIWRYLSDGAPNLDDGEASLSQASG